MNEWKKRPTDFILGIILHLRTVIQINIIYFCLRKRDTGSGPLYPIMGFGQMMYTKKCVIFEGAAAEEIRAKFID